MGQLQVAHKLASLLSPESGSVIFGSHRGEKEKGWQRSRTRGAELKIFCHSPVSFKEMWEKEVFGGEARLRCEVDEGANVEGRMMISYTVWRL